LYFQNRIYNSDSNNHLKNIEEFKKELNLFKKLDV
jgi:hypothetical protein